jgi:hypothetical protein
MKRLLVIPLLIFFGSSSASASEPADSFRIAKVLGVKLHRGSVLVHSRELVPLRNSNPIGLEVDLAWHKLSQKAWKSCHCYPKLGVAATYWNYDQPDILGHGVTGLVYIEPVFGARRTLSFSIRAGFGLSYQTRPYDPVTNPDNLSYSTYVAFPLQLGGTAHIRLKPQWYLDVTAVYNHFSNGGIRDPNKGINWPSAAIGVGRYLDRPEFLNREKKDWREDNPPETRLDIVLFLAFNEPRSKLYMFSPGIEVKASRQIARINALTLGTEWIYDNSARHEMRAEGETASPKKGGVAAGHEFLLGKFVFSQQFGYYLYNNYRVFGDVYQRYGLVYRASRRLSAGINLKSHAHVADFVDFRVGASF